MTLQNTIPCGKRVITIEKGKIIRDDKNGGRYII